MSDDEVFVGLFDDEASTTSSSPSTSSSISSFLSNVLNSDLWFGKNDPEGEEDDPSKAHLIDVVDDMLELILSFSPTSSRFCLALTNTTNYKKFKSMDMKGNGFICAVAASNELKLLKACLNQLFNFYKFPVGREALVAAASHGAISTYFYLLEYFDYYIKTKEKQYQWEFRYKAVRDSHRAAASAGQIGFLENYLAINKLDTIKVSDLLEEAVMNGQINVIDWIIKKHKVVEEGRLVDPSEDESEATVMPLMSREELWVHFLKHAFRGRKLDLLRVYKQHMSFELFSYEYTSFDDSDWPEGIEYFLTLSPASFDALTALSRTLLALGNVNSARFLYKKYPNVFTRSLSIISFNTYNELKELDLFAFIIDEVGAVPTVTDLNELIDRHLYWMRNFEVNETNSKIFEVALASISFLLERNCGFDEETSKIAIMAGSCFPVMRCLASHGVPLSVSAQDLVIQRYLDGDYDLQHVEKIYEAFGITLREAAMENFDTERMTNNTDANSLYGRSLTLYHRCFELGNPFLSKISKYGASNLVFFARGDSELIAKLMKHGLPLSEAEVERIRALPTHDE